MSDLKIGRLTLGVCATNCYFVYHEGQSKVIFFDPADQGEHIYNALKQEKFTNKSTDELEKELNFLGKEA